LWPATPWRRIRPARSAPKGWRRATSPPRRWPASPPTRSSRTSPAAWRGTTPGCGPAPFAAWPRRGRRASRNSSGPRPGWGTPPSPGKRRWFSCRADRRGNRAHGRESTMPATDRLAAERRFHDRQAEGRAADLAGDDALRFHDDDYLDHETWIRPAF